MSRITGVYRGRGRWSCQRRWSWRRLRLVYHWTLRWDPPMRVPAGSVARFEVEPPPGGSWDFAAEVEFYEVEAT